MGKYIELYTEYIYASISVVWLQSESSERTVQHFQ